MNSEVHMQIMSPDESVVYFVGWASGEFAVPVPREGDKFVAWHDIDGKKLETGFHMRVVEVLWNTRYYPPISGPVVVPKKTNLRVEIYVEPDGSD